MTLATAAAAPSRWLTPARLDRLEQILRLLGEARLLGEDPAYREFCTKSGWRLIPGVF